MSRWTRHRPACLTAAALAALVVALLLGLYYGFTGPRDDVRYPPRAASPYRLPWPAGEERLCVQGNRAVVSHRGRGEFAWDFAMPTGSPVCAARGGEVIAVVERHEGRGPDAPNNRIVIDHGDGTRAHYLHLRRGGARVERGQQVERGQRIGASGNVGRSLLPHLHLHVTRDGRTIPISFADVAEDGGVPLMFRRYTSGNRAPR